MNEFGTYLRQLRKSKGMTQQALAELLDVSDRAVSKWENGEAYPETGTLLPLSDIFGVTVDALLHGRLSDVAVKDMKQEKSEEKKRTLLFYVGESAAALCSLVMLIFVFFMGCKPFPIADCSIPAVDLFYYFGNVYTDLTATKLALGIEYQEFSSLVDVSLYTQAAFGTLFSAVVLSLVLLFSLVTLIRYIKLLLNIARKDLAKPAVSYFFVYLLGCALLLSLNQTRIRKNGATYDIMLNAAAITGLVFGAVCLCVFLVCRMIRRGKPDGDTRIKYIFSAVSVSLLIATLFYLASPVFGFSARPYGDGTFYSLFSLIRLYGTYTPFTLKSVDGLYLGTLADGRYDGLDILLLCVLLYLPILAFTAAKLILYANNFCDERHRTLLPAELLCPLAFIPYVTFVIVPAYAFACYRNFYAKFDGLVVLCILFGLQTVIGIVHFAVKYAYQYKRMQREIANLKEEKA